MKRAIVIGSLFFFLALKVVFSANIAPKLKQSDRRAIGLVPYPRVGRSRREPTMYVMRNPRVGRSFIPNANVVSEPELDTDVMFDNNHGLPIFDMEIGHQGQNEIDEPVKQLQILTHIGLPTLYSANKLLEANNRRTSDILLPWSYFLPHRGSTNSENRERSKRDIRMYI